MTLAITPTNTNNTLVIEVIFFGGGTVTNGTELQVALFQDSTADALAAVSGTIPAAARTTSIPLVHTMTAGTTSATTFKVRAGMNGSDTTTFNGQGGGRLFGGVAASSIVITEVSA